MRHQKNLLFTFFVAILLTACGSPSYSPKYNYEEGIENSYYDDSEDSQLYEYEEEIGNPYDEDSGHGAGYKWAEETGGDCDSNSDSFNEGCEEYYSQMEQ